MLLQFNMLHKEVDNCLDQLIRIEILLKRCDSINEFKEQDYIDYLNFLENENYEELIKYEII